MMLIEIDKCEAKTVKWLKINIFFYKILSHNINAHKNVVKNQKNNAFVKNYYVALFDIKSTKQVLTVK